eukprot:scaffold54338_cov19-Tisochrysis_lutea.AAC.2
MAGRLLPWGMAAKAVRSVARMVACKHQNQSVRTSSQCAASPGWWPASIWISQEQLVRDSHSGTVRRVEEGAVKGATGAADGKSLH